MRSLLNTIAVAATSMAGLVGCSGNVSDEAATSSSAELSASGTTGSACGTRFVARGGDASSTNDCRTASKPCAAIQQAVGAACAGDTVLVGRGTFVENVVVDKPLTVLGAGDRTVIVPAASNPNPCTDSSLCGGAASSVVLVRANHVTLERILVDGDNPALTSGTLVGGVDVDARNGIITDDATPLDALTVRDVTVRNVFLRGIDASSGGTFRIERSRVFNVSTDPEAIGIFNTGGTGTIADNVVARSGTGIASNFSRGVVFERNRVTKSGAGIHTDNAGASTGSSPDRIEDNVVTDCTEDGYGFFVFVPSLPVTLRRNRVAGCDVGMAAFGQGAPVQSRFVGNRIDGRGRPGTTGLYITTSQVGFGSNDVDVLVAGNVIDHASVGIFLEQQSEFKTTADVECNLLAGDVEGIVTESSTSSVTHNAIAGGRPALDASGLSASSGTFRAPDNWWGCAAGPSSPACGSVSANVDPDPVAPVPPLCTFLLEAR